MKCSKCGGLVIWKGPMRNLTHTECQSCGAENSQIVDDEAPEDELCVECDGYANTHNDDGQPICSMCRSWMSGREP